jgi:hypothetical protein
MFTVWDLVPHKFNCCLKKEFLMVNNIPIAEGIVESLAINGEPVPKIMFELEGPVGDNHAGFVRYLSGHDSGYIRTSNLSAGSLVFNWRSWTGLSTSEINALNLTLGYDIPVGCLLENIIFSKIPNFSKLEPGTRLVFPAWDIDSKPCQAILAVWEENGPCKTVGKRLENHYNVPGLTTDFVRAAQGKRGVMGFVLSPGLVCRHDQVLVYPPVR